jgi:hypothetical protein
MLPWNLLKSSNSFTSYLSAYSVFLSSIAGVMVSATVLFITPELILMIRRSRNIISFGEDITAFRICMTHAGMAGTGIHTVSISGHIPPIFQVY